MNGATLRVLQVEWERAWMSEDFDKVTKIDNARKIIEGLTPKEEIMNRQTLVNYIKRTSIPYPAIIKLATGRGWIIEKDTLSDDSDDRDTRTVTLTSGKETPIIICYYISEPNAALFTSTSEKGAM